MTNDTHDTKDWIHCTGCPTCRAKRWEEHTPPGWVAGVGDTHSESWKKDQSRQFHRDMDSYREATRNGLQPEMVSQQAVEKAEQKAYLEDRLIGRT